METNKLPTKRINKKLALIILLFFIFAIGISAITDSKKYSGIGTSKASALEPADINNDGKVDIFDLSTLLSNWSQTGTNTSDINADNVVNVFDLSVLLSKWGAVGFVEHSCVGKPDSSCTGVPVGTSFNVVSGDLTISTAGAIVDSQDIRGFLIIQANDVIVKNTIVRGRTASGNGAFINIKSGTNIIIQDTEIAPTTPSVYLDGIWGDNFTGKRLNIHGGVDGMKIGDNSRIESSYIHDMQSFASDPNQGGGVTHNDAIQILQGSNITLVGNNLVVAQNQNAAIQITQDYGVVTNLLASGNWMDGGGCTINIAHKVLASLAGVSLQNNRFGRNSYYGCPILLSTQSNVSRTGNVYDDNNQAVPVQIHD